jgi:hypothetical protein
MNRSHNEVELIAEQTSTTSQNVTVSRDFAVVTGEWLVANREEQLPVVSE